MSCTSDLTDEEVQVDRTIKANYEPCHNCRKGVMDLVEITTKFSILELPIWKLASNQQALHCTRCRYTVPFIELKNHIEDNDDEHDDTILLSSNSIPPSTSFGDTPPELPQSPSRGGIFSLLGSLSSSNDVTSKNDEIIIISDPETQLPNLNSTRSLSSNRDVIVTSSSQIGNTEIINIKSCTSTTSDTVDPSSKEEKEDDLTNTKSKAAQLVQSRRMSPFQACYHNLIVITDEDELLLAHQEQQKKLLAEMVLEEENDDTIIEEEQKEETNSIAKQVTKVQEIEKTTEIKETVTIKEEAANTGRDVKNAIILDDVTEESIVTRGIPQGIIVKVIPVIEGEDVQSTISKQSSYFPTPIDLSNYGLSSWKGFSI